MPRYLPEHVRQERDKMFATGKLWCNGCNSYLHVNRFGPLKGDRSNYGYNYKCRHCRRERARQTGEIKEQRLKKKNKFRKNKSYYVELFGGKCARCGFSDSWWALEFHHVFPSGKKYTPSRVVSLNDTETALKELDKCVLICSNCHRTYGKTWEADFNKIKIGYVISTVRLIKTCISVDEDIRPVNQLKMF